MLVSVAMVNNVRAGDTTFVQRFDLMSRNLNRSAMKTKVLYDRVFPYAKLNKQLFKEEERDSLPKDYLNWKQIYLEMYSADYDNANKHSFDSFLEDVKNYEFTYRKLPIGIIHYQYEYIDSNAYNDGRISVINNQLISSTATNTSPFILSQVTSLSLLSNQLFTGKTTIVFDKSFVYSNLATEVKSIRLNFNDDKGVHTLTYGDTLELFYATETGINIDYQIEFGDGYTYSSSVKTKVVSSGTQPCVAIQGGRSSRLFFDLNNVSKGGEYEYGLYYSQCNRVSETLYKPILVLDGFDPGETRKVGNIYDLMNSQPAMLADDLRAQGHDIIICNFPVGADFIERNALGVIEIIEYIKARTSDKIIVIGPSMGGLIAKYALALMEKENRKHNVGLYLSLDAPHQGANIPIGDQYFLYFFGEIIGDAGAREGLNKVNSPAARQMLIHHYAKNSLEPKSDSYRQNFFTNIINNTLSNSKGYPLLSRNVALINGSEVGNMQGIAGELFSLQINKFFDQVIAADAHVYASPNSGTGMVANLYAKNPSKWFNPEHMIKYASVIPNNLYPTSLDNAPGGKYDGQFQITHDRNGNLVNGFSLFHAMHNFIPSTSALDITFPDGYINYRMNIREAKIMCNKWSPFAAYYAPTQNEGHVQITANNAKWIKRELRNGNKTVEATSLKKVISGGEIFNYGVNTKDYYTNSFQVTNHGVLGICKSSATGYNNEPAPPGGAHFEVEGYNVYCDPLLIEVSDRGKVIIGDWNRNTGVLKISENSIFHLSNFAELIIYENSTLFIEKGSKLIIGKNALIDLQGKNSQIIIEGSLEIEDDAIFSFKGEGQVFLKTSEVLLGHHAKIEFVGKGMNDVVLLIDESKKIAFPFQWNSENKFSVKDGKIELLGSESYINTAIATELNNVNITGGRGLIVNGQKNVRVSNCVFNANKIGITAYLTNIEHYNIAGDKLRVDNSLFKNNEIAIKVFGKGFQFINLSISECKKGIQADGIEMQSELVNAQIEGNALQSSLPYYNAAINYMATTNAALSISNSTISKYNVGVYASQASLILKCSQVVLANYYSLWVANNAVLNMGPTLGSYAGNNTLSVQASLNNRNVCLENAFSINIANGGNRFKINADEQNQFISGTMSSIPQSIHLSKNNWYTRMYSTSFLNPPAQKYFFIAKSLAPTAPKVQNFLVAPVWGNSSSSECSINGSNGTSIPTDDPCKEPGSCEGEMFADPLAYSPNSALVNINGYATDVYNAVLKQLLNRIKEDTNDKQLLNNYHSLCELYSFNEGMQEDVRYLKHITYLTILELFDKIDQYNTQSTISEIDFENAYQRVLKIQDQHLHYVKRLNDAQQVYYVMVDRAQLASKRSRYQEALDVYAKALEYADHLSAIQHANYWMCITHAKLLMQEQKLSVEQMDSILNICPEINKTAHSSARLFKQNPEEEFSEEVEVYPNPSAGEFHLSIRKESLKINSMEVLTLQGQVVFEKQLEENTNELKLMLPYCKPGMYVLKMQTNEGLKWNKLIVHRNQ